MIRTARRRRRLGIALLAFGLSGIVLVLGATALVLGSLSVVDDAVTGFERQRAEVVAVLGPAALALTDAASSASNAGASLTETSEAAARASSLSGSLADSFEGLASLGSFEILGARPFGGLSSQFAAVGAEARTLAADLSEAAVALQTNKADSDAVAADLRALAAQLTRLDASLRASGGVPSPGTDAAIPLLVLRVVLLGLLTWLAVPAAVSVWLGRRLLRGARSPV
jgi:hypothetical protein